MCCQDEETMTADRHLRMTLHAHRAEEMDDGDPKWTWAAICIDLVMLTLIGAAFAGILCYAQ